MAYKDDQTAKMMLIAGQVARAIPDTAASRAEEAQEAAEAAAETAVTAADYNTAAYTAPVEATSTASAAHAVGEYFTYNGYLYETTAAIAVGGTITPGTNCAEKPNGLGGEVCDLKSAINDELIILPPVTPGDVGRALVPKTVSDGKVTAWDFAPFTPQTDDKRYGVSGIGQEAAALTRLYDSVGMVAQVGTDGNNASVVNDFDLATPFMRRKCVGHWTLENGRAKFNVAKYLGETGYTEDGSIGDYVAVECPLCYYYLSGGVLVISSYKYPGFRPFDIFCRNHDPEDLLPVYYLPAYALAKNANGKAVSLPGYDNFQGCYKDVVDACRTYNGDGVEAKAIPQPMAVNFYEWALFTVEFATQNCQSVMNGCAGLRHNADERATLRADGKWLLSNYQAGRVVGEYVSIMPTSVDINAPAYYASHKITAITRCDAEGNADASGAYQLVETEDLGLGREYTEGESYRFAARPYRTGACNGVSTPSGSPVSNSDGYHPMKYRWRENVFANQYKTIADLFNKRVGTGDSDYKLEWYFLPDPASYTPSSTSKPDADDLATDAFVKLIVETAHENYVNGYIKSKQYDAEYHDLWIPHVTTATGTTYYCDYAYIVSSHVVRACRVGGSWYSGAVDGFSSLAGNSAPSFATAYYGGDLFMPQ